MDPDPDDIKTGYPEPDLRTEDLDLDLETGYPDQDLGTGHANRISKPRIRILKPDLSRFRPPLVCN